MHAYHHHKAFTMAVFQSSNTYGGSGLASKLHTVPHCSCPGHGACETPSLALCCPSAAYWSDKYLLLRLCRQPAAYGVELPFMVHALLPYAAVAHVLFAIWAFGLFGSQTSAAVGDASIAFVRGAIEVGGVRCGWCVMAWFTAARCVCACTAASMLCCFAGYTHVFPADVLS